MDCWRAWIAAVICGGFVMAAAVALPESVQQQGVSVAFRIYSDTAAAGKTLALHTGEHVSIDFRVEDTNQAPLSGLYPAAWIHPASPEDLDSDDICISKAKAFIGGGLLSRAELDLNVYYVLTLNQDASINVVDPLFGFGGSKLLGMLPLNGVGFDWAVSAAQDRVFVSLPSTNEIAEINTANWQLTHHRSAGQWKSPTTMSLQSGQLWTLIKNGLAIFDHDPFALKKVIRTKGEPIAIKFSANERFAYVLSQAGLDVINAHSLSIFKSVQIGDTPVSMDYSKLAEELYISHAKSGKIWIIDGQTHAVTNVLSSESGIGMLRFSPNGRWGFLLNPVTDRLSIIDSAKQRIVQSGRVEDGPESIAFSDQLAYVRHKGSSNLLMIALDDPDLGREGAVIPAIDTPGGDNPPGLIDLPSGGAGIVRAPGNNAVLVSNYRDKAVYFYKEGMAAPMGQFNNYGKSPRAVLAVDHSLKERKTPGTYSTSTVLPGAGDYQAIFFMDSPRLVHCFSFNVEPESQQDSQNPVNSIVIKQAGTVAKLKVGKATKLAFRVENETAGTPLHSNQFDVDILLSSGLWRQRLTAELNGEGHILVNFVPPLPGSYDIYVTPTNSSTVTVKGEFNYDVSR